MKHFCFLIHSLYGGGAERVALTLASAVLKLGHRVDIILLYDIIEYDLPRSNNFRLLAIHKHKPNVFHKYRIVKILIHLRSIISAHFKLKQLLQGKTYDLVISHSPLISLPCKFLKLKNLYHCIHNEVLVEPIIRKNGKNNWDSFSRILYKNQNLIAVSNGVKASIEEINIQFNSVQVIYNPLNFEKIRTLAESYPVVVDDYILGLGRLHSQKRFDILIRAFAQAKLNQKLLIFGKGEEEHMLKKLIVQLNLEDRVELKGYYTNPYPYIKNAKAVIVSSDYEGFSLALVEALVLNTPVVSTSCSGPSEILIDALNKFLVQPGNIEALSEGLRQVIQFPPRIHPKYYEKFDHLTVARKYLSLC